MEPPQRWTDIVIGLACGLNQQEIAAGLDESRVSISTAIRDIQSSMAQYNSPADFLSELLGVEVEGNLDLEAVEAFRTEKAKEAEEEDEE